MNWGGTDELRELMLIKQCLQQTAYGQYSALRVDKSTAAGSGGPVTTYIGNAPPGSDPAAAVWQISKIIDTDLGGGSETTVRSWAQTDANTTDGLLFNKVWSNRSSYVYKYDTF